MFFRKCKRVLWAAGLALLTMQAPAADWPQWRGPQGDGISRETGLLKQWPAGGPKKLWETALGSGYSAPSIVGGRIFVAYQKDGQQWATALEEKTGKELWKVQSGKEYKNASFDGPRVQPVVDGERVYCLDALGNLQCLQTKDGKEVWKKNILDEYQAKNVQWGVSAGPLVDGERLIVTPGESKGASVVALDKKTGKELWRALDDKAGYAATMKLTLGGKPQIVIYNGFGLVGLVPETGKTMFRYPWPTQHAINSAQPVWQGDTVFISSGYGQGCALVKVDAELSSGCQTVWRSKVMKNHFNSMVVIDDYIYGFDDRELVCVEYKTGQLKWRRKGFDKGTLLWADGLAYVLGEKGNLVLAKLTPEKFELLAEVKGLVSTKRAWTMPVIANGRLYLRDEEKLVCLDIKGQ